MLLLVLVAVIPSLNSDSTEAIANKSHASNPCFSADKSQDGSVWLSAQRGAEKRRGKGLSVVATRASRLQYHGNTCGGEDAVQ